MTTAAVIVLVPYFISVGTSYSIAIYCWRRRTVVGAGLYAAVALCWALMTTGYIFELLAPTLSGKIFWDGIQFYPSLVMPIALLAFSVRYADYRLHYPRLTWSILWIIAGAFGTLVATSGGHNFLRADARLIPGQPFNALIYSYTPPFLLYTVFVYGVAIWAIALLVFRLVRLSPPYRSQLSAVLIGNTIPYLGAFLTLFGIIPASQRDTTPFWFAVSNLIIWWGLYHYQLFDLMPIARDKLVEQLDNIVVVVDAENQVVDLNHAAEIAIGKLKSEMIGKPAAEVFPLQADLLRRCTYLEEINTDIEVPGPAETKVAFNLKITPLHARDKKLIGRLIVAHEITQLKQIQAELSTQRAQLEKTVAKRTADLTKANLKLKQEIAERKQIARDLSERDERLKRLTDATFEGIAISEDGIFVEVNRQMADMLDVTPEGLIGQPISSFIVPVSRADVERRIKMDEESTNSYIVLKKDGARFPVEVRTRIINYEGRKLRMSAVRDMTEQNRAEQSVKESEERFRLVLENMPILLDAFDDEGNIIIWNKACEEATGYAAGEMIGNPRAMEILYPDSEYRARVWQASLDPNSRENTFTLTSKSGEARTIMWFDIHHYLQVPGWAGWGLGLDVTERKRAEDALRDSEKRYRAIIEDQTEFVVRWKPNGIRTYANEAYCRYFGLTYDQVVGSSFFPLIAEDARKEVRGRLDTLTPENPVSADIHPVIKPDGSRGWQEWTDHALFDEQDRLIEMQSVGRDVSQRIFAEESEREQRTLNEALVEISAVLNSMLELNKVLDSVLSNLGRAVKYDAANIMLIEGGIGRIVGATGYPHNSLPVGTEYPLDKYKTVNRLMTTAQPVIIADTHSDPLWLSSPQSKWVRSVMGVPIPLKGEVIGAIFVDSTVPNFFIEKDAARLLAFANQVAIAIHNARLYESEHRERKLAETLQQTASALLRTLDPHDTLTVVMDQLAQVVNYDQAMLLSVEENMLCVKADRGLPDADNLVERTYDIASLHMLREPLTSGDPMILADVRQRAGAAGFPGAVAETRSWMAIPLLAWGIVTGLLIVGSNRRDAFNTEVARAALAFAQQAAVAIHNVRTVAELSETVHRLREAQVRLSGAARLAAAGEIAAGVAHQLNNPLTAVIAEVSLLLKHLGPSDRGFDSVQIIQTAAEQAAAIVHRQLNLSKSIPYEMVVTDTNKSVAEALSLVRAQIEPSARLVADLAPDLPPIMASPEHLSDVWLNLLLNARDGVAHTQKAVIRVVTRVAPEKNGIIIAFEDNGEGIPHEHLEHIFDPFFTTRSGGHGLGLPVCYEVVRRHDGTIEVDSREGQGTTIRVTLPIPRQKALPD